MTTHSHYDEKYFSWQKRIGIFGSRANLFKFSPFVTADKVVVEFGCGGGYLLARLPAKAKIGIEINPSAVAEAERQGIKCVSQIALVGDEIADVIISNSTLEHIEQPLDELRRLLPKLKPGGIIIFSVPCESSDWAYAPSDINQHLYTYSPMSLGNLFATAGFVVDRVDVFRVMWPPQSERILSLLGEDGFHVISRLYWIVRWILSPLKPMKISASIRVVARRT